MTNPLLPATLNTFGNAPTSSSPFVIEFQARNPTPFDNGFPVQKIWLNTVANDLWLLKGFSSTTGQVLANWIPFASSATVETLTGNTGTNPVFPDGSNNINTLGDGVGITVNANAAAHTLTWSLVGGGIALQSINVDAHTAPGTNPVVPSGTGAITVTGGQIAAGSTANVIRSDSLAANAYTIEVQRSQAVAVSTVGANGVSHFNSADFTVDGNGFVSITNFSPFNYVQINHASSPYTVSATDYFISCDPTAGTITVRLPNAPTQFREFIIKDRTGQASINNISVSTVGGVVTIDGQTTYTMSGNYDSISLLFNGASYEVY